MRRTSPIKYVLFYCCCKLTNFQNFILFQVLVPAAGIRGFLDASEYGTWLKHFQSITQGDEETKQNVNEISQGKGYLELEILINDDDNEILGDDPHGKMNKYKPYFTGKNNKRTTKSLNRRKVVMVHGDGRMSRKQVIR